MKRYILFLLATLLSAAVPGQTAARTDSLAQHPQSEQTASAAYASDPDKLWDQANTAYINNDFPTAISLYETILSSGRQSGKLYYNLANAYFKEQEIGRAILNYNRALRLNPGNEDIRSFSSLIKNHIVQKLNNTSNMIKTFSIGLHFDRLFAHKSTNARRCSLLFQIQQV